jgi:hypothetical protein
MIYLFGKADQVSVVYDGSTLTEADKKGAVVIESLPPTNTPAEHNAQLCLDNSNKPFWKYVPIPKDTLEDLVFKEILTKEQYKTLTGKDFVV